MDDLLNDGEVPKSILIFDLINNEITSLPFCNFASACRTRATRDVYRERAKHKSLLLDLKWNFLRLNDWNWDRTPGCSMNNVSLIPVSPHSHILRCTRT